MCVVYDVAQLWRKALSLMEARPAKLRLTWCHQQPCMHIFAHLLKENTSSGSCF